MHRTKTVVTIASLALLAGAGAWVFAQQNRPAAPPPAAAVTPVKAVTPAKATDGEQEVVITLAQAPEAVATAILAITAADNIVEISRDVENGKTIFDLTYTADGKKHEVELSDTGAINETDGDDDGPDADDGPDDDDGPDGPDDDDGSDDND